jgi:hypothetical protein
MNTKPAYPNTVEALKVALKALLLAESVAKMEGVDPDTLKIERIAGHLGPICLKLEVARVPTEVAPAASAPEFTTAERRIIAAIKRAKSGGVIPVSNEEAGICLTLVEKGVLVRDTSSRNLRFEFTAKFKGARNEEA